MLPILAALLAPSARAEAVIEFKTTGPVPVQIFVDGRQATLTGNLRQRVAGLEAGVHELRVSGMFGKTLYEAEIELPDDTLTTAAWDHGQIEVLSTEWLKEDEEEVAAAEEPVEAAPIAVPEPPVVAEPPPPPIETVGAAPVPPPEPPAHATTLPSLATPRTLTIQASDGMRVEIVRNGQKVVVVVDGDTFRIEDPSGLSLALGTPAP